MLYAGVPSGARGARLLSPRCAPGTGRQGTLRTVCLTTAALACGGAFAWIGYRILAAVHPAEDAYILFKYADNLAHGHGIVFNIGGPRTEGATDFLWLLLIAGGIRLGGDVALVALAWNALGAALAGVLLARACWGPPQRSYWIRLLLAGVLPAAFLAGGALGGYWGFSSMLYCALVLLSFAIGVEGRGRVLLSLPLLGIVLALFRPDGAIAGAGFTALGLWRARAGGLTRTYLTACAAAAAAGVAYFAWRWMYFGLPLPLPLYVKQNGGLPVDTGLMALLPGLAEHAEWLMHGTGPSFIMLALAAALAFARIRRTGAPGRTLLFLLPVAALFAALAFAVQTQNINWRFQAPAYLVLLYALVQNAGAIADAARRPLVRAAAAALVVMAALPSIEASAREVRMHGNGRWRTYLEMLAPRIGPALPPGSVVALTEAGALPFWTRARVADLVGLNLAEAAVRPPGVELLEQLEPDMVFLHQGTSLETGLLRESIPPGAHIHQVAPELLGRALRPSRREAVERRATRYRDLQLLNVQYAPAVMIAYLSARTDYDVFVIDLAGGRTYLHVLGLKKDWPMRDFVLDALRWSMQPGNYASYLEIRRKWTDVNVNRGTVIQ